MGDGMMGFATLNPSYALSACTGVSDVDTLRLRLRGACLTHPTGGRERNNAARWRLALPPPRLVCSETSTQETLRSFFHAHPPHTPLHHRRRAACLARLTSGVRRIPRQA